MSRRGQLLGHIVIFIIGLIVAAMLLTIGYVILSKFDDQQCDVQRVRFGTQLYDLFAKNRGYGTSQTVTVNAPCETIHVCFVDRRLIDEAQSAPTPATVVVDWNMPPPTGQINMLIQGSVQSRDPTNVFTIQTGNILEPVERFSEMAAPIEVPLASGPGGTCISVTNGQLRIKMEGNARAVEVKTP